MTPEGYAWRNASRDREHAGAIVAKLGIRAAEEDHRRVPAVLAHLRG